MKVMLINGSPHKEGCTFTALKEVEKLISEVYYKAEQDVYINSVAKKFDVKYENIRQDVDRLIKKNQFARRKEESDKIKSQLSGYGDRVNPDFSKAPEVATHEENVLGLLLLYPEHRKKAITESLLSENDFFTEFGKKVFDYIKNMDNEDINEDINLLFSPEEVGRITKMKYARMNLSDNGDIVFLDSIAMLKKSINKKSASVINSVGDLDNFLKTLRSKEKDGI